MLLLQLQMQMQVYGAWSPLVLQNRNVYGVPLHPLEIADQGLKFSSNSI